MFLKCRSHSELSSGYPADGDGSYPIDNEFYLPARDLCQILVLIHFKQNHLSDCVPVNRSWKTQSKHRKQFVLCLFLTSEINFSSLYDSASWKLPKVIDRWIDSSERDSHPKLRNKVFLASRERYHLYRFVLYCDHFHPRGLLFPKGSVGGCYMMP